MEFTKEVCVLPVNWQLFRIFVVIAVSIANWLVLTGFYTNIIFSI